MLIDAAFNNYMQCCLNTVQHETINLVTLDSERSPITVLFRLEYDSKLDRNVRYGFQSTIHNHTT